MATPTEGPTGWWAAGAPPVSPKPSERRFLILKAAYGAGARATLALPPRLRYSLAEAGGGLWYLGSPAQRRAARANYAAVLGRPEEDPAVARLARRAFANYGQMLADFVLLGHLQPQMLLERVTVSGREHMDAAVAAGRGTLVAMPHTGSWDVAGSAAGALGYPIWTVADRFPGSLNEAVVESRRRFGLGVIPVGRSAVRGIASALEANQIVALLADLPHGPGEEVRFFGRRAVVPSGPAAFALKTGAPLLTGTTYRTGPGRYHIQLDGRIEPAPGEGKQGVMQRVVERFEGYIRERPDQWYAFRSVFGTSEEA